MIILKKQKQKKFNYKDITKLIIEEQLYNFENAKNPEKVVCSELSKMIKKNEFPLNVDKSNRPYLYFY